VWFFVANRSPVLSLHTGMKCDRCEVERIDVQSKMAFRALPAGEDWSEFPVLASVCPKCGKAEFQVAVPTQFKLLVAG